MLTHNTYFDGKVRSVGFERNGRRATVGVVDAGEFHFGTEAPERMTVTSGELWAKLPGDAAWRVFPAGTTFEVPGGSGFDVKAVAPCRVPVRVPVSLATLLARDPVWRPSPEEAAEAEDFGRAARAADAPAALVREVRWWRAREAADRGDWSTVTRLAEEGLADPFSEREAVRLAFLHCASGDLEAAEHVIAQAVQTGSAESLPARFSQWCAREGLVEAAERFV